MQNVFLNRNLGNPTRWLDDFIIVMLVIVTTSGQYRFGTDTHLALFRHLVRAEAFKDLIIR